MAAGDLAASGFDLPGVPWVQYITKSGISFHGTFWHNDYGRPRSQRLHQPVLLRRKMALPLVFPRRSIGEGIFLRRSWHQSRDRCVVPKKPFLIPPLNLYS